MSKLGNAVAENMRRNPQRWAVYADYAVNDKNDIRVWVGGGFLFYRVNNRYRSLSLWDKWRLRKWVDFVAAYQVEVIK